MFEALEEKLLGALGNKLSIESQFDEDNMTFTVATYWDNVLVHVEETSIEPLVDAIVRRINDQR